MMRLPTQCRQVNMEQQNFMPVTEPTKRDKTGGEHLFDLTTYGGFALVGNEVTATAIINQADKHNLVGRAFRSCGEMFKHLSPEGKLPYIQQRMNYINFAIIGGFTMVPFIKWLEDNKGKLVRFADHRLHSAEANNSPEMQKAHAEMDEAPRQSWGSLMKGRVTTVAAAYAIDSTIGWDGGLLARAAKGTKYEKYASFDHLSNLAADKLNPSVAKLLGKEASVTQGWMRKGAGLLTLSTALTALFYASSKLFATHRDHKIERREERSHDRLLAETSPALPVAANDTVLLANDNDHPGTQVSAVEAQARLHDPALLEKGVGA